MAMAKESPRCAAALGNVAAAIATATGAAARKKQSGMASCDSGTGVTGSRFHKLEMVGCGTFGVVYRARDRRTGEIVAMKCLRGNDHLHGGDSHGSPAFAREVSALEACSGHPSIVQHRASGRGTEAFLVMEFVGPTLRHVMKHDRRGRRHTELEVRLITRQLLAGAGRMHRLGLMHRDLKPENVLVDGRRGSLKICDLGLSCSTADGPPHCSRAGTRGYRAPELLLGSTDYDARIDSWAIGCIMAELLAGKHPFRGTGRSNREQLSEVLDILGTEDIREWPGYDGRTRGGAPCSYLRNKFPCPAEARMTGEPALSEAGFEVLSGLLRCNPDKRWTAARALQHRWFKEANPAKWS